MKRPYVAMILAGMLAGGCVGELLPSDPPVERIDTLPLRSPTLEDARLAAAEQLRLLPANAKQVDCAPGMRTLPPYTTLSGGIARVRRTILADGRCFEWDTGVDPRDLVEMIIPTSMAP